MKKLRKSIVIITGASSGMGQEFAIQLDGILRKTDEIWIIARRRERLVELSKFLETPTRILAMDVTNKADMIHFKHQLKKENAVVRMLINSAGFGLMGAFSKLDIKEQLDMIDLNCKALTELTYHCIPHMRENSRIIQLSSSAAFLPQKNFAIYAATKSYVLSFSRALQEELRDQRIWVTAVCPGPVETEFFDIAEKYSYTLAVKKLTMVTAPQVVKRALIDSYYKRTLSVYSIPIRLFHWMCKMVPHSWILRIMNLLK